MPYKFADAESWILKHERIVLVALVLMVVAFLGNKYLDKRYETMENRAIVAERVVEEQKALVAQNAADAAKREAETKQTLAQYQAMLDASQRQIDSLTKAVSARNTQLAQQQAHLVNAPLPEVADRVKTLAGLDTSDISVAGSSTLVSESGTRQIASKLETVPVLEANLKDVQQIADTRKVELDQATKTIGVLNTQVSGLNTSVTDLNKLVSNKDQACNAQIDAVKAKGNKSKRNWFVGGVLTGAAIVARIVL